MLKNDKIFSYVVFILIVISYVFRVTPSLSFAEAIIVNHTNTDLSKIPDNWIEQVKSDIKVYYGHTSHGSQLIQGLKRIQFEHGPRYSIVTDHRGLPKETNALCVYDRNDTYDPGDFFPTVPGVLSSNPEINVVMYGWCGQPSRNNWQLLLKDYIGNMKSLEQRYPNITFVYMTGHAQEGDCAGCNRQRFNEALRKYCLENNKVLFDFGDLDVWYLGKVNTYVSPRWCACSGSVPREHPHWGGGNWNNPCAHTTYENCDQKGKAVWWMLSKIRGWGSMKAKP